MEKLEANTLVIVKLQEEVNSLNTKCQDRDTEIKHLKDKITKAEDDIKTVNAQKVFIFYKPITNENIKGFTASLST